MKYTIPFLNSLTMVGKHLISCLLVFAPVICYSQIPAAPTTLVTTTSSTTQINLTWTDASTNETGFQIERSLTTTTGFTLVTTTAANATSFSNTGLTAGTRYFYRIRATNANGNSAYTTEANATANLIAPTTPAAITASATQINLTWADASANETGFQIERSLTSATGFTLVTTTAANAVSFSNTGLTAGTRYFYRIRAINATGNSAYTAEVNATASLLVPTTLAAVAASPTQINLTWVDASANETGFQIERSLTTATGFTLVGTTAANAVSFSNTGLTAGTRYFYRIRAINATGNSAYTAEANATASLLVPTTLAAVAASATQINLTWVDASANETGFQIERSLTTATGFTLVGTTAANAVSFSNTSLPDGTKYFYRIRAINATGTSAYTAEVNATTTQQAPTTLTATPASTTQINLTWADVSSSETGYQIERSLTTATGFTLVATTAANATTFSNTGLIAGTRYFYRIRATNANGNSAYTAEANATTNLVAPSALSAVTASTTQINLTWVDGSSNETGFQIERSLTSGTGFTLLATTAANAVSYSNTGLAAGTKYYYRVRAVNATGISTYTNEGSATTSLIVPTSLLLTAVNTTQINLTWADGSINETGFQIERSLTTGTGFTLVTTTAANAISFSNTGLTAGTTYFYRVRAVNANGTSAYTAESSIATIAAGAPIPPTTLVATTASTAQINLTWVDASTSETGFQIERSLTTATGFTLVGTTAANVVSFSNTGLTAGTRYFYRIRAINATGNSAYTAEVNATASLVAPTTLSAVAASATQINLTWVDASANETGFQIERSLTTATGFTLVGTTAANVVSFANTGLTAGTRYFYRIRAINATGNSAYTAEANATASLIVPTTLAAVAASATQINLTWVDASANETGFQIERSLTSAAGFTLVTTTAANVVSFSSTDLADGTKYFYRIRAINATGTSAYTAEVNATTTQQAPTTLTATPASTTQINLTWADVSSSETGFQIERSLTTATGFTLVATTAANVVSFANTELTAGTQYFYRIRAINATGNSAYTAEANATTSLIAPTTLTAVAASATQINLTWADVSTNETGFQIERSLTTATGFTLVGTTAANVVSFANTGLTAGTQYFYRIRAINATGNSAYTAEANATASLLAPTTLAAVAVSATQINLTWVDASANETGFQIERSLTTATGFTLVGTTAANVVSFSNTGLTAGTRYFYRIRAINATSNSAYTAEANATASLLVPTTLAAVATSATQINLTWVDASANETGFQIERSLTTATGFTLVGTTAANAVSFANTGLTAGTRYFYRIRAVSATGNSAYTAEANATTSLVAPTTLAAVAASATQINLTWVDASANETGFQIERSLTTATGFTLVGTTAANVVSFANTGLTEGTQYFYRIRAVNATGNSAYTAEANATTSLVAPTTLAAVAASATQINLTWVDASANETGFQIERSLTTATGFTLVTTTAANAVSFSNTGLTDGTKYFYRIRGINATATSAFTAEVNTTTTQQAPTMLTATPTSSTNINLTWADVSSSETGYQIERSLTTGTGFTLVATTAANVTTFSNTGLTAGTRYFYRISATNANGNSAYSAETNAKAMTQAEEALELFSFQYKYDGRRRMTHKKVPGAEWVYMVYDQRDRLVMTQDGEQRKTNKWTFTKYDPLNRPVVTGLYNTGTTVVDQPTMQGNVDTYYNQVASSSWAWYETFSTSGSLHGYDNKSYPNTNLDVLTVTYYDNYDFKTLFGSGYDYVNDNLNAAPLAGVTYSQPATPNYAVIGQVTGTKVKVLGGSTYLKTVSYVDDKYRPIQSIADNAVGYLDRTSMLPDFVGKVLATKTTTNNTRLHWKDLVRVTPIGSNLVASAFGGGWGYYGAASVESIPANTDGWMEVTASETTTGKMIGFSSVNTDAGYTSINYAIFLNSTFFGIYENGTDRGFLTPMQTGDLLRIERVGTAIRYLVNGMLAYTSPVASTSSLLADVTFWQGPATIASIKASFALAEPDKTIARRLEYDHAGRLLKTWHSVNGATEVLLAQNEYNEIGQLVDKKLYSTDNGTNFKQSVDYRYNIRGWLTSMNNAALANDGTTNDDTGDLFGMELLYNQQDVGLGNNGQFNGNISAIKWSNNLGLGTVKQNGYTYGYDPMNRITSSNFKQQTALWSALGNGGLNETGFSYDLNGNILGLTRNDKRLSGTMDNLGYTYLGNQLQKVTDSGDKTKGFVDGANQGNDYTYDANGNMTLDNNKNITAIVYNHLNLPAQVTKNTGEYVKYTYDATGRKLRQEVYAANGTLKKSSDYSGEYFYENDTLKFINHEEGRVTMTTAPEYQYHLKDHLGNVRLTFTTKQDTEINTATMETAKVPTEQGQFLNYSEAIKINATIFDRTHRTPDGVANTTFYSTRLTGGTTNAVNGLAKSLSVMPGDKVDVEVFAKYLDPNSNNWSAALANFMTSIAAGGGAPVGTIIDGNFPGSLGNNAFPFPGQLVRSGDNGTGPKAYLNYLLFDRDYVYKTGGFKRLTTSAIERGTDVTHERLFFDNNEINITEAGYLYVWLSNENDTPVEVYFDDFKVTYTKSPVVQSDDYYPFGLTFNTYSRENSVKQDYLYNGKELQDELNIGWYDYQHLILTFIIIL